MLIRTAKSLFFIAIIALTLTYIFIAILLAGCYIATTPTVISHLNVSADSIVKINEFAEIVREFFF